MKKTLRFVLLMVMLLPTVSGASQGWVAEVDLDLNHSLYAFEKITNASVTFSGANVSGSSSTSQLRLVIYGQGPVSGELTVNATGLAWEPYDREDPESVPISALFSGNYTASCETGYFQNLGDSQHEQIYVWITIYPRMEISEFMQTCDELQLTTNTCSSSFLWEVNDEITGDFETIPGKTTASISITREELMSLGFLNPFGRKYFRVTGLVNTTSQLQPVDIYYPGPSAALTASPPKCHNGNDGAVAVNITSTTAGINDFVVTLFRVTQQTNPVTQEVIIDDSQINFDGLSAGKHLVRVENNTSISEYGSCWTDHLFELVDPDPVTITSASISDYNGYQLKCYGSADGRIQVRASGGTNVYALYEWIPSVSTTGVAENLPEGDYQIKVKDSNHCWSAGYNYSIQSPEKLSIQLQSTGGKNGYDVTCLNKKDGEIVADAAGGVKPYDFEWSNGYTTSNLAELGVGTYKLLISDNNGCVVKDSIELHAPEPISFSIAEVSSVTCPAGYTGSLEINSLANTIGEVTYLWSSGENETLISQKPSGVYTATVTDGQGCTGALSYTLAEPLPYAVNVIASTDFNGSPIRCSGEDNGALGTVVRDENGMITAPDRYTWTKNGIEFASGIDIPSVSGLTAGVYGVTIIYSSACSVEETFILTEPEPLRVVVASRSDYNGVPISCSGMNDASILATASGGTGQIYNYLWDSGETTMDLVNIGAGSYHITVTDINGCESEATKTLEEPQAVRADISILSDFTGQPVSCSGAADARLRAAPIGGTPPFTYEWNSGHTTQEIAGLPAGNYILQMRDVNGCTGASEISIADPPPVRASFSNVSYYNGYGVSCAGKNDGYLMAHAGGGTGRYTFKWEDSFNTDPLHENLGEGSYTVIVTDENGCSDMTSAWVSEPDPLFLHIEEIKNVSCNKGTDGEIQLAASGGAGDYKFSAGDGLWQNQPILTLLVAGTYGTSVQDANACVNRLTAIVTEPPAMVINFIDVQPARCGDALGKITSYVNGGTGNYQYAWQDAQGLTISSNASVSGLYPGIYTLFVTDGNSCEASRSTGVPSLDGPKAIIKHIIPVTCADSRDGKAVAEILEGHGPFAYEWSDGQQTADAGNLEKGTYLLQIVDSNGCVTVETATIPGPLPLEIELSEKVEPGCHNSCDGKLSVTARGGNGGYSFMWPGYEGPAIDNLCAGNYMLTVTDQLNCRANASFDLRQPDKLTAQVIAGNPRCPGQCNGQLEINARGGTGQLNYEWDNGRTDPVITDLCTGSYTAQISDENNCETVVTYTLEEPETIHLELGGPLLLCEGQTYTVDAGPALAEYKWTGTTGFTSNARQVTLSEAGAYVLEAVDLRGCSVSDTFFLDTSDDLLKANFLMATEAAVRDTVVMIDISWPLPENISWIFPDAMNRLSDSGDIVHARFDAPGKFDVTLKAILGGCKDQLTKIITVIDAGQPENQAGRLGYNSFIKEFTLFPNPNDGAFDVAVELVEESPVVLTIWSTLTSRKIIQLKDSGRKNYFKSFDLRPLSAGSYTLRLDHAQGTRSFRFIVR